MDKAAQAEHRIKNVCDALGITSGGRLWMDVALDPFKDIAQKPQGYPDKNMAPSVIQTVHDYVEITAPSSSGSGNWDCNIFLDSLWKTTTLHETDKTIPSEPIMFNSVGQNPAGYNRGGLVVRAGPAGLPLTYTTTQNALCLPYVTDVFDNGTSARIIAIGLEIHNTTASLHKQGSIITYRVSDDPGQYVVSATRDAATPTTSCSYRAIEVVSPPEDASHAIDLPGSLQWDAEKGAYIVPLFNNDSNPAIDLDPLVPIDVASNPTQMLVPIINGGPTTCFALGTNNAIVPITLSGAYLTGLSAETTLTVNLTYYIEQFPSIISQLKRLSAPSCPEDFAAIELYTKVARKLPTGVEVNDNFLGAFVSGVSRIMQQVAPRIPAIINGVGSFFNALDMNKSHPSITEVTQPRNQRATTATTSTNQRSNDALSAIVPIVNNAVNTLVSRGPSNQRITNVAPKTVARRRPRKQTVKNQRDKGFSRLDTYIQASNAGNRRVNNT